MRTTFVRLYPALSTLHYALHTHTHTLSDTHRCSLLCACTLCYTAGKKRESATSLKAECDRLDKENYRLLQSQGNLAQLGAKMTNGTRRFRTFFELERKGRERQRK